MAYDAARRQCVQFGGAYTTGGLAGDTALWNGTSWTAAIPAVSPPPRCNHAMAFDSARQLVVLFGGQSMNASLADTWEWNGTTWTVRGTSTQPAARFAHGMAFDPVRARTVLFGGYPALSDTWEWDGLAWLQRTPPVAPPGRDYHAMAFDLARARTVIFGGVGNGTLGGSWEWDGTSWMQRATPVAPTATMAAMAFDAGTGRMLLFGAGSGTWSYGPVHPAQYMPFGSGCPGATGLVLLAAHADTRPWLGDTFVREARNLPPASPALLATGLSNTSWNGNPLPFPLQALGMPGCWALVSPDVVVAMTTAGTTASVATMIPVNANLLGLRHHDQAVVLDPTANALGVVVSNAATGTLGGR
jgi:hypothetical protein